MPFRIHALDPEPFRPLFSLNDEELAVRQARRVVATRRPGFPCRVSLADAEPGEELLLVHFEHQPAPTPFRAGHAIYVRQGASRAFLELNEIPAFLRSRMLSLRAFSAEGMMHAAEVVQGGELDDVLPRLLERSETAYIHLHSAGMGCYLASVERI